jgi:DNA adenine methylase
VGNALRPPIAYFGGKTTLAPQIAALLPPHRHYVEPYCGSLAVLLAKDPSPMETVNDLDQALVTFWRVLRDRPGDLARVCALTPHARAEQTASYDVSDEPDDLELARRVWVQLTQGRAGTRRTTGWRHYVKPSGDTSMTDYLDGYLARMAPAAARLRRVSLECRPALELIDKYGAEVLWSNRPLGNAPTLFDLEDTDAA